MRWNAVTLDDGRVVELQSRGGGGRGQAAEPKVSESDSAKLALDRIVIPQDASDRIAEMLSPRSSLIISDEEPSAETSRDTEFVVVLSGEPQGSLKSRRRGWGN
jgi:hypothetical protein